MRSERVKLIAIIVACVPLHVLTLVSGLFVATAFNPIMLCFMGSFDVRNDTDEPIWITPIGGYDAPYCILPQYLNRFPVILAW